MGDHAPDPSQCSNNLKRLAYRLGSEQASGVPYRLQDLPADHPADRYAKEFNPEFDTHRWK
jgi:hypothetical protein